MENEITYDRETKTFECRQEMAQKFINHLNAQNIQVQPPQVTIEGSMGTFVDLQLQSTTSDAEAEKAIQTFRP